MSSRSNLSRINIETINLWSHVGVLEDERLLGQSFLLDISIWVDVEEAGREDDLLKSTDYSLAIISIQELALKIECFTIECFSEQILNTIESLYGRIPMHILLRKCSPPIDGFTGSVSIERDRYSNLL
ncbi:MULTISPECIES: dihydroneopterin aldolase [unclassified Prochlorococcus]|uniref:dihydroneopterin aldolase n=1 Tax=unclassified Prochlorococcus TaxID=2627481 RepID=UPI000564CBD5|nr:MULTISPECIES: dihydroneopterin aldolase [unclassified Prochlorococcus]